MTAPDGGIPDGSLAPGLFAAAQAKTLEDFQAEITAMPREVWQLAQDAWKGTCQQQQMFIADMQDGQNALRSRVELLNQVSGHACAVMGNTWSVPHSTWVKLPFTTQLGPVKNAAVQSTASTNGVLVLKAGGLWRVDAHVCVEGYTQNSTVMPVIYPPYFIIQTTYNPIDPEYLLEVLDAQGNLLTAKRFNAITGIGLDYSGGIVPINHPHSSHFQHTFVIEDMPPPDDPSAPDHWVYVRVSLRYEPYNVGMLALATCKAHGGTRRSSLTASRWSRDISHLNYSPTVPDGGDLV